MSSNWVAFDLETRGMIPEYAFQAYRLRTSQAIVTAASVVREGCEPIGTLYPATEHLRAILNVCAENRLTIVGWNITFDITWLLALGLEAEVSRCSWLDAMLLWRHLYVEPEKDTRKRKSYSLEAAMHEFYPDDAGFKEFKDFQDTSEEGMEKLLHRNVEDSRFTLKLAHKFWDLLSPAQQRAAQLEARCIPMVARTHLEGLRMDRAAAEELSKSLDTEYANVISTLHTNYPETKTLNLGSPKQLSSLLFDTWKIPSTKQTKGTEKNPEGNRSTDKEVLFDLAVDYPHVALVKTARECQNNKAKYAEATIESLDYNGDGVVRPAARIFGTYTSRMTYSSKQGKNKEERPTGVALHQWKRGKEYRKIIQAPEGYDLVELDFAGQEFRWMAVASNDQTMLDLCAVGEDAHSYMGSRIACRDYRELVKMVAAEDAQANNDRKLGKFCISEGELVLTQRGLVEIEKVLLADWVWDGVEWVRHTGVVYQGDREVITYEGLTATPDHKVYLGDGSTSCFGQAAAQGYKVYESGVNNSAIREHFNSQHRYTAEREDYLSRLPVSVWQEILGFERQPCKPEVNSVQGLCYETTPYESGPCNNQRFGYGEDSEKMQRDEAEMFKRAGSVVPELRSAGDSVQLCKCSGSNSVCIEGTTAPYVPKCGHRQSEQRRELRTGESKTCNQIGESQEQENVQKCVFQECVNSVYSCVPCIANSMARSQVCSDSCNESTQQRVDTGADTRSILGPLKLQTKRTYDITNAGQRHRYTVSNALVCNSNLSFQYRIGSKAATAKARVEYGISIDENEIKNILNTYKSTFNQVPMYWTSAVNKAMVQGYAETYAGRRVQLKGPWHGKSAWESESTAINYPIQGTGGDQKYLALAIARNLLPQMNGYLYFELHDGLFFILPKATSLRDSKILRTELSNLPYKQAWNQILPIQFPVDLKIGPSWGELKGVKDE